MGGTRWCKNCHSTHEGSTGSKCQRFDNGNVEHSQLEGAELQASNVTDNDTTISQEQARLVVQHMENCSLAAQDTSTGDPGSSQELILLELQKISQKCSQLEDQAAKDRVVLKHLVSRVNQQGTRPGNKKVNATTSSSSLFPTSAQSLNSNGARPKTRSEIQILPSTLQGVKSVNVHQRDVISLPMVLSVNATPISSVQLPQCVNQGVIQESGRSYNGEINFTQHNHLQSQNRRIGATCYPQKHNLLGNMATVSHNMTDHNVMHVPRSDTTVGIQDTAGNNQMVTSMNGSHVNTHNNVNTEGNNVVYFAAQQTATNQEAMARDDRCQPALGGDSQIQMA